MLSLLVFQILLIMQGLPHIGGSYHCLAFHYSSVYFIFIHTSYRRKIKCTIQAYFLITYHCDKKIDVICQCSNCSTQRTIWISKIFLENGKKISLLPWLHNRCMLRPQLLCKYFGNDQSMAITVIHPIFH